MLSSVETNGCSAQVGTAKDGIELAKKQTRKSYFLPAFKGPQMRLNLSPNKLAFCLSVYLI